jgi:hypothetical protein
MGGSKEERHSQLSITAVFSWLTAEFEKMAPDIRGIPGYPWDIYISITCLGKHWLTG